MFRKNTASQFIHFQGVDSTTGGIKSGVSWTVRRCIDGTFAAATGTATEDGTTGWYKFAMSQADTNGNNIGFNFTGTGAVPQTVNIVTTACDPTSTAFGLSIAKTTNITGFNDIAATAIVSSGAITTSGGAVSTVTTATNVTTVNGLAANVITATSINADAITAAKIATGAIDADALAADAGAEIAAAVWDLDATAHQTQGTFGQVVGDSGADTDSIWSLANTNLDATVSSRLATAGYTAPLDAAGTRSAVGLASANLDTQLDGLPTAAENADAVWDEDATAHQTQGTFGQAIGDPAADTNTIYKATVTDAANATVGADTTALIATALTEAGVRTAVGLASANLDTQLDALPTAAENATAVLTTAMTESYAADGATATLAQALYQLLGRQYEFAISGDTLTVKKLDGATTAMTFTLAPAGGPYTSITRAS